MMQRIDKTKHTSAFLAERNLEIVSRVVKGRVNECYVVRQQGKTFFLKLVPANRAHCGITTAFYDAEVKDLGQMTSVSDTVFTVPQVIEHSERHLMLQFLTLQSKEKQHFVLLARALAQLHASAPTFGSSKWGWAYNNFNGLDLMCNETRESWWEFFKSSRLQRRLDQIRSDPDPSALLLWIMGTRLADVGNALFSSVAPALLHGDLNTDNWGMSDDRVSFFDPALMIGDPEYDLACFTCFEQGELSLACLDEYKRLRGLSASWIQREQLYHFYILLSSFLLTRNSSLMKRAITIGTRLSTEILPMVWRSLVPTDRLVAPPVLSVPCKLAVLVLFGTFSPVHRNHIGLLDAAAVFWLQNQRHCHVVGGFLSPSTDARASRKLRQKHFPLRHRVEMLRLATQNTRWSIDLSQMEAFENANNVLACVAGCFATNNVELFIVCGSDVVDYVSTHAPVAFSILCLKRIGDQDPGSRVKVGDTRIFMVDYDEKIALSSTLVRSWLGSWYRENHHQAHKKLVKALGTSVLDYLTHAVFKIPPESLPAILKIYLFKSEIVSCVLSYCLI